MRGGKRLSAAIREVCQREFVFALVLQRNGAVGWERRDDATQWRALLSDYTLELMDAATAAGIWTPDVEGAGVLDQPLDISGDDPLRAATVADLAAMSKRIAREKVE